MTTFHPPEKWVALNEWLQTVESVLGDWRTVKEEAERCLSAPS